MTTFHNRLLLQVLRRRSGQSGFTLIELLVVIIIIGILAAIALPSFLNQANKARQSEAQTYIGALNRSQQAFYLQNRYFADDLGALELGLSDTDNYEYRIAGGGEGSVAVTNEADPIGTDLKGYAGTVWLGTGGDGNATTLAKLCESETADGEVPECEPG